MLQPPKPPPALRASTWEKILKSMSQFIPYFSASSSGYPCKMQQTDRDTDCRDSACLPQEGLWRQHRENCNFTAPRGKKGEFRFLILPLTSFLMLMLKKIGQVYRAYGKTSWIKVLCVGHHTKFTKHCCSRDLASSAEGPVHCLRGQLSSARAWELSPRASGSSVSNLWDSFCISSNFAWGFVCVIWEIIT